MEEIMPESTTSRRHFLKTMLAGTGAALATAPPLLQGYRSSSASQYMGDFAAPSMKNIRCGFVGVGARGSQHLQQASVIEGAEIVAFADPHLPTVNARLQELKESGLTGVKVYSQGDKDYLNMYQQEKLDVVIIATPWEWHARQAIDAMNAGIHAFVEVPLGITIDELWEIVETAERRQKHCMMMENVCFGEDELMFLNIVRQGIIGELLHGEAAYIHDLRSQMDEVEHGTGSWRTYHYSKRNGNLYPTHGLGPISQYMNLARGEDNFASLVSFSSPAKGRQLYAQQHYPPDHKWNQIGYRCGDINTSIIKTHLGRTIMVQWDETSPRPYTRHNLIQGTKGTLAGFPTRIALDEKGAHEWIEGEALAPYYQEFEHPLHKRLGEVAQKMGGHGGMDFIMLCRIFECLRQGLPLDQNVYEGCFWSAVAPLSEKSVREGGMPQKFPDFTRGLWKNTQPLTIIA
jgi:predicted dehydrogenase